LITDPYSPRESIHFDTGFDTVKDFEVSLPLVDLASTTKDKVRANTAKSTSVLANIFLTRKKDKIINYPMLVLYRRSSLEQLGIKLHDKTSILHFKNHTMQ
jgi:hypothetical protein